MPLKRPHVLVAQAAQRINFKAKGAFGGGKRPVPVADRAANAERILTEARAAIAASQEAEDPIFIDPERLPLSVRATTDWGVTASAPGRADVLSVIGLHKNARTNVALAPENFAKLVKAADNYVEWEETSGKKRPDHFYFFESVPKLGVTSVQDLWASELDVPEEGEAAVWEIWLKPGREERLRHLLVQLELVSRIGDTLNFANALVVPVVAPREKMERLAKSAAVAQLRPASALNAGLMNMEHQVQALAVTAAASRVTLAPAGAPRVCLLDTGLAEHPLLDASERARLVVGGTYTPFDYHGHGTRMAGLALFDDLAGLLAGGEAVLSAHLESVAVEPPPEVTPSPRLPAARLRAAVEQVEGREPARRTFCFAMNAVDEASDGMPSSLSTELDRLAFNSEAPGAPRLFCAAAGNIPVALTQAGYQDANDAHGIQAPAQAWNVLTVSACTELEADLGVAGPLAPNGDLSPWSRTSVSWPKDFRPPSKPDIVFEGGNQQFDPLTSNIAPNAGLLMLTTENDPNTPLTLTGMTSAATASAAGFAARLQAEYPGFWEETIRGLFIHAAEHTPAMQARVAHVPSHYGERKRALRKRFGFGRTNKALALENAANTLTLISQGELAPFRFEVKSNNKKAVVLGEMGVHKLPWPIEALVALGVEPVELRVTLSYFIEPNSGQALLGKYDFYPSHGLDFAVQASGESDEKLLSRVSAGGGSDDDDGDDDGGGANVGWTFAHTLRGRGGVKHDRWNGTAEQLASMGTIVVFPRSGWWRGEQERVGDKVRYSLISSIRTRKAEIYTAITVPIAI